MRKEYIEPQLELIVMQPEGMLCLSGGIGGNADEPGHARVFDFGDENYEDE